MLQVISLLVENKPGALMRITGVLSARGYNIESLTVARTLDPTLSRMTIAVHVGKQQAEQATKQLANASVHCIDAPSSPCKECGCEPACARTEIKCHSSGNRDL